MYKLKQQKTSLRMLEKHRKGEKREGEREREREKRG